MTRHALSWPPDFEHDYYSYLEIQEQESMPLCRQLQSTADEIQILVYHHLLSRQ